MSAPNHYENFPVGSIVLPRRLRRPIHAVYAFARYADDLADEGDATPEERKSSLHFCGQWKATKWTCGTAMATYAAASVPNTSPSATIPLF